MDHKNLEIKKLLLEQSAVIDKLKELKVVRTTNNPLGDYTEWLVGEVLGLVLETNSKAGFDGIYKIDGRKVQIKGRRITPENQSRQLSAIRNYDKKDFDELAAVIFNKDFEVIEAVLIPHEVIKQYASHRKHVNAHILILKGPILSDPRVKSFKDKLCGLSVVEKSSHLQEN